MAFAAAAAAAGMDRAARMGLGHGWMYTVRLLYTTLERILLLVSFRYGNNEDCRICCVLMVDRSISQHIPHSQQYGSHTARRRRRHARERVCPFAHTFQFVCSALSDAECVHTATAAAADDGRAVRSGSARTLFDIVIGHASSTCTNHTLRCHIVDGQPHRCDCAPDSVYCANGYSITRRSLGEEY